MQTTKLVRALALSGGLAAIVLGTAIGPATAAPLEKVRANDVFTDFFTCETTGTPVQHDADYWVNFMINQRGGSSPFPYFRESVNGTDVYTNLDTGGTFTVEFTANTHDHVITDNGDGTITVLVIATGGSRFYDTDGNFVLNDPGQVRLSFDVDYNGTPSDPSDDVFVDGSFQVVRESTGRNDTEGRDFCEDLVEFTS
jgi:hypothetical protein